ncbi:hypothetical protein SAMN06297387_106183 [Streptomyces zhaozhouensis]|uniref:Uncharacterized protein n=1 Tax=Streptomyces zhaozhouensis TaxID=1300267 RepID=A0A286DVD3_9ACTN|nr:hypothetical protein [Streptomyces zhaozhouensis]SOD62606.1 hypothetical protein SAMN06297387_106183 [Streptomyces zhaozhouensis]
MPRCVHVFTVGEVALVQERRHGAERQRQRGLSEVDEVDEIDLASPVRLGLFDGPGGGHRAEPALP